MTYEWDDIIIVGDSFCAERTLQNDWLNIFAFAITGQKFQIGQLVRGEGYRGGSWWSARKKLLEELKHRPAKVLVCCHTEPYRIPNDKGLGLNTRSVCDTRNVATPAGVKEPSEQFINAAQNYYEYIICEDFHLWAYRQWFQEIDEISLKNNIEKVIHLLCFDGYQNHTFSKGVTMEQPLATMCNTTPLWTHPKTRNHFSTTQNIELGATLANIIKNYPGDGVRLNTKLIGK